jgi:hypothetical protein
MRKIIEKLKQKPESYRHKVAFFTATVLSLAIFFSWAGAKGYIGMPDGMPESEITYANSNNGTVSNTSVQNTLAAREAVSVSASSPLDNSKNALSAAFSQFSEQFAAMKESLANVFVPFIGGIEVYESK